jgi:hypothetical protein
VVDAEAGADGKRGGEGFELKAPAETNVEALQGLASRPGRE